MVTVTLSNGAGVTVGTATTTLRVTDEPALVTLFEPVVPETVQRQKGDASERASVASVTLDYGGRSVRYDSSPVCRYCTSSSSSCSCRATCPTYSYSYTGRGCYTADYYELHSVFSGGNALFQKFICPRDCRLTTKLFRNKVSKLRVKVRPGVHKTI